MTWATLAGPSSRRPGWWARVAGRRSPASANRRSSSKAVSRRSRLASIRCPMNTVLWLAQALLAVAMLGPGFFHTFRYNRAIERLPWMAAVGKRRMAIIGILEILGGIGLIVPAVTGILVWLTPL